MRPFAILLFVIQVTALAQSQGSQDGKQTSTPVVAEKQEASKPEMKGKIIGIGGIFFKSADPAQTREWYGKHLGLVDKGQGAILPWREKDDPQNERMTVWSVFPATTKYFDPGTGSFMVNYIVDDIDALLERLEKEGVKIDPKRQDEAYGRFAWIYDPDGNKIELWQPPAAKK
jgi:catechol 2,3-dioxygenase-like lactoylglutathione lyase family enzyme